MFNVSSFLNRFLILDKNKKNKTDLIIKIIKKHTNIYLNKENIILSDDFLKLKTTNVFKNEIFLNKDLIIKDFNENNIFLEIRF